MIIECRQCRTKFRFNEAQLQDEGVWLRCGRCGHVFFQATLHKSDVRPPDAEPTQSRPPETIPDRGSKGPSPEARRDDDVDHFMKDVLADGAEREADRGVLEAPVDAGDIRLNEAGEGALASQEDETGPSDEPEPEPAGKKTGRTWKVIAALWSLLVIVAVPVFLAFVVFPEWGERYMLFFRQVAGLSQSPARSEQSVTGYVKLQDIRQRIVTSYTLGNVRIVEGTAVNTADFPMARILIEAEIVDAYSVALGRRQSYAGNLLTDDELTTLAEDEMLSRLSRPEGNRNLNERIPAGGQIPFMIVFTREPSGSIKTSVTVVGAERLL
ncbi:MAG TPA: DUF3426 domain-containing protein [Smithellaceae bacterium]|nr:DUF3426 domain-containing protein [Smithellaceae bacterium]